MIITLRCPYCTGTLIEATRAEDVQAFADSTAVLICRSQRRGGHVCNARVAMKTLCAVVTSRA